MTPDEALALLREGNAAFLRGDMTPPNIGPSRHLLLAQGHPPLAEGKLKIVGAYYSLPTGEVDFFDDVEPAQDNNRRMET